jgi:hypothetical protein
MPAASPIAVHDAAAAAAIDDSSLSPSQLRRSLSQTRFICTYFAQLELEYHALCGTEHQARTQPQLRALQSEHRRYPSWAVNHRFEFLVMDGLPEPILRQRIAIYHDRLVRLVGPERVPAIEASFALDPHASFEAVRALGMGMLSEIQRLRHVRSEFERLRNRLLVSLLGAGVFFGGAVCGLICFDWLPPMLHVLAAGLLGGYFSVLVRLGALRWCLEYNTNYQQVDRLFWNLLCSLGLSMFEGAVGALVLFTVFESGLLKGSLFPEFPSADGTNLASLWWMVPSNTAEAAKLIVWCVLAGFSERLIPDFLSGLARQLDRNGVSQPAAAAVQGGSVRPT